MGRCIAFHDASGTFVPKVCVTPQSSGAATLNGTGIDLAGKSGAYFILAQGTLTGSATVAGSLEDSPDNSTFTAVNATTYPEAALAATTTDDGVREMHYTAGPGRQRYVRAVATVAVNTALVSIVGLVY